MISSPCLFTLLVVVADAVRDQGYHPWDGDIRPKCSETADRRDREADEGAVTADSDYNEEREQARRRDHHVDDEQLREEHVCQQNGMEGQGHLCDELALEDKPYLRLLR